MKNGGIHMENGQMHMLDGGMHMKNGQMYVLDGGIHYDWGVKLLEKP